MNNYQKALDEMCTGCYGGDDGCNGKDIYCSRYLRLQQLIDKETPKQTKTEMNEHNHIDRICPICNSFVYSFDKYCSKCGQRIRSDE